MELQLHENTPVSSAYGEAIGRLDRVVIDPRTGKVTHLVVRGDFESSDRKVIPFRYVQSGSLEKIVVGDLPCTLNELPDFEETHFIVTSEHELLEDEQTRDNAAPALYYYPPANMPFGPTYTDLTLSGPRAPVPVTGGDLNPGMTERTDRNIPEGTVALHEDADVITSDGKTVGDVDRVIVDSESGRATHFLISKGLLFKSEKMIPKDWIDRVEEDRVYLAVDSEVLNRLPDYSH